MRLSRRLTLTLACICALAAPSGASAGIKSIWGPETLPDGSSAFPLYKKLGVEDFQTVVPWSLVAPTRPTNPRDPADPAYQWSAQLDLVMAEARRNGIDVTLIMNTTPPWANGNLPANYAPLNAADFGDFAHAVSKRYPSVRRFSVWSEADRPSNFRTAGPQVSWPREFAKVLDAGYVGLKQAGPRDIVIAGATDTAGDIRPRNWLDLMKLPNGKRPRLDWWGHNAFSARFPDLSDKPFRSAPGTRDLNDIDTFIGEIRKRYGRKTKMWISEYGIQTDRGSTVFNFFVTRKVQARWLRATYGELRKAPYVAGIGWYRLLDDGDQRWGLYT
ncbi:MAG: hypothetical protein H0T15_09795, partial [Thermoleophilaceae bacterium]|nr:hypothetical protein [Thermoleophilaceae bacterium]